MKKRSKKSKIDRPVQLDPDAVRRILVSKRFLFADQAKLDLGEMATWDTHLLREHRLLVPIDLQALYVPPDSSEPMVRLPMRLAGENRENDQNDGMPEPFDAGTPRPPGVHLHWAMPDALLRGSIGQRGDQLVNRLALPVLPDRWVVLRILHPRGRTDVKVTGWVLEADRAIAVPLGSWKEGGEASETATRLGVVLKREELTGTVGGMVSWSGVYDAVLNRFAFHDPLSDIAAPDEVDEGCASYLVAGWWSDPASDPLDSARSSDSLDELLDRLRWRLLYEWGDEQWKQRKEKAEEELRKDLSDDLASSGRWEGQRPQSPPGVPRAAPIEPGEIVPLDTTFLEQPKLIGTSAFSTEAIRPFIAQPWHLRASLLHGSIYGVPVSNAPLKERRPDQAALSVAMGFHDDDLLAAFASQPQATPEERRELERLLAAFTAQKVNRLSSPDGLVEIEEFEHSAAFSSLPSGSAGTDRFLQRVQTGGVGGLDLGRDRVAATAVEARTRFRAAARRGPAVRHGRPMAAADDAQFVHADLLFSAAHKPTLVRATEAMINEVARSRVGDVLAPTEARVVDRPAARFTFPTDPMVGIRGAARSLRHGGDGRNSADRKLTCRWPTHVITEISGIIGRDRFIRSLGNGSVPGEILSLARECVLHDPYHDAWLAEAVSPSTEMKQAIFTRLVAESVLRFGRDGTYDGATVAFKATPPVRTGPAAAPRIPNGPLAGEHQTQTFVADVVQKFSLFNGVDPDIVAITTWAQPWIPMWLEWEIKVEGVDPVTLESWQLASVDLEQPVVKIEGATAVLRGRSHLTTGAAATLHDAFNDWRTAEDALDKIGAGEVEEPLEAALRDLDENVRNLDVVTATLDGIRAQLLGFKVKDGLRRPGDGTTLSNPAPDCAPSSLVAGCVSLTRARLLDIFGRTLEVPLSTVATPTRETLPDRPGALALAPRLLRPARWQFRLVEASTPVGAEGVEARVDQIEPSLQVSPVAGFVMPDHLDESLELFSADGSTIGELFHGADSGGVMWEIAPGRQGPADAGPLFELAPAQQSLGLFAAGLIAADAAQRKGAPLPVPVDSEHAEELKESALSSLLRAIDTTLWTVDTFAALGSEHVAGLVGRPIAVVRAQLRLELRPPDDVDLSDPQRAQEWAAAEDYAARYAFPVRIGELTRSDDGVLGFFVDDDYSKVRLVDKVIAHSAKDAGRSRGQLELLGETQEPDPKKITAEYVVGKEDADTLMLHLGETVTLTLFMQPAGKVTLTSGILPRKALGLARDWVAPGLHAIAPSLRTGPVLVETDLDPKAQVRLPKVSVFGKDQNFLWRDTPATWRTDAILAATQTALLPETPAEFREGWIRVVPEKPPEEGSQSGEVGAS